MHEKELHRNFVPKIKASKSLKILVYFSSLWHKDILDGPRMQSYP